MSRQLECILISPFNLWLNFKSWHSVTKRNNALTSIFFVYIPFSLYLYLCLCTLLQLHYLLQISLLLGLSCVFKLISHGSVGVCIRACHKQSAGMSSSLLHRLNPVKWQMDFWRMDMGDWWLLHWKDFFNYPLKMGGCQDFRSLQS